MADHNRGRGALNGDGVHPRVDEEDDSLSTIYISGFWRFVTSFVYLEKKYWTRHREAMDGVGMNDESKGVKKYGTQQT